MFINHGTSKVRHKVIWFLSDIDGFCERKLYVFEIQGERTKIVTVLSEKNNITGEVFQQRNSGKQAKEILEREQFRKLYTSEDVKFVKGKPCGWIYGENIEIHDKKGNVIQVKQKACDFNNQKETIKILHNC